MTERTEAEKKRKIGEQLIEESRLRSRTLENIQAIAKDMVYSVTELEKRVERLEASYAWLTELHNRVLVLEEAKAKNEATLADTAGKTADAGGSHQATAARIGMADADAEGNSGKSG